MMKFAIDEAMKADGEIPVGAVIVCDGKIIASACNKKEKNMLPWNPARCAPGQ